LSYWEITNHKNVRKIAGELPYILIYSKLKLIFDHVSFLCFCLIMYPSSHFTPHEWTNLKKRVDSKRMVIILHTILGKQQICFWKQNFLFWSKNIKYLMKGCAFKEKESSRATKTYFWPLINRLIQVLGSIGCPWYLCFHDGFTCILIYDMVGLIEDKIILIVKTI